MSVCTYDHVQVPASSKSVLGSGKNAQNSENTIKNKVKEPGNMNLEITSTLFAFILPSVTVSAWK